MRQITVPDWLMTKTFVVEYNPSCPKQFLVRLTGHLRARIDHLPTAETGDAFGYSRTLVEAANVAKVMLAEQKKLGIKRFQKDIFGF